MSVFEDLEIGQTATLERIVYEQDIRDFARISGDDNPVHLDEEVARETPFKGRVAHGILVAGHISAAIGTRLPGHGSIYLGQSLRFRAPVRIGDTVVTRVTVRDINTARRRVTLDTVCSVGDSVVIDGSAEVMMP